MAGLHAHDQPPAPLPGQVSPIYAECLRLRELVEWAETLLCNARPREHCSQAEWDALIVKWRDQKHALRIKTTEEILAEDPPPDSIL
jgi:hypothetical protein